MLMSVAKAKLLVCPIICGPVQNGEYPILYELDCFADRCPMWRFYGPEVENGVTIDRMSRLGYCGLAGKPEFS